MRFLKVAGEMGPKTVQALVDVSARVKSVKLGEQDTTPVTEENIRAACEFNGSLVLYSDSPNPQCLSRITAFCHRVGLQTWAGDTKDTPTMLFGASSKVSFLAVDPDNVLANALLHQPRRKTLAAKPDSMVLLKPETLAELTPLQRHRLAQNITRADELDAADLHDFKNKVENKARGLKKSSRAKVLEYMDQLAAEDLRIAQENQT